MKSKISTLDINTTARMQLLDITSRVENIVAASGVGEGTVRLFTLHTTAGLTINENADPDVARDILMELDKVVPLKDGYRHAEGNSAAHIKSSLVGVSLAVFINGGRLVLAPGRVFTFASLMAQGREKSWLR